MSVIQEYSKVIRKGCEAEAVKEECLLLTNFSLIQKLRMLLFGSTNVTFGNEWAKQGFRFRENNQTYGLIQNKPGPCGMLAAIQGHVLQEFLFGYAQSVLCRQKLKPDLNEQKVALSRALAYILLQAGEGKGAIVVVREDELAFTENAMRSSDFKLDGLTEFLHLRIFRSKEFLLEFLDNTVTNMMDDDSGSCVTFLYSVLLTRGIERISKEMDDSNSCLIGEDGYCSQEVINLLLIGKAVTNTFDGDIRFESGNEVQAYYGISKKSRIGFLSMFEYTDSMRVGNYYKNPTYPIWILCTRNHFTVLFSTSLDILKRTELKGTYTLFHYDGMVIENKECSFTIEITDTAPQEKDPKLPAIELCILTKWPTAKISPNF